METKSYINHETCKKCMFCAEVCPNYLMIKENDKVVFRDDFDEICIKCGHCMAVCTTDSIFIEGIEYGKHILPIEKDKLHSSDFQDIINRRRAIRKYKDKAIEQEKIDKILEAISMAPISFPPNNIEVTVITDKAKIREFVLPMRDFYAKLIKMLKNPVMRFFIKKSVQPEIFTTLMGHIKPMFEYKFSKFDIEEVDPFFRNAPAVFIIHADEKSANHTENGLVAMTYGILAAESLGLGATPVSLLTSPLNKNKDLKRKAGIPDNNEVITSFVAGYKKFIYKKTIKRDLKGKNLI